MEGIRNARQGRVGEGEPQSHLTVHLDFLWFGFSVSCTRINFIKSQPTNPTTYWPLPPLPSSDRNCRGMNPRQNRAPVAGTVARQHSCGWFSGFQEPWQPRQLPWRPQGTGVRTWAPEAFITEQPNSCSFPCQQSVQGILWPYASRCWQLVNLTWFLPKGQ